MKSNYSKKKKKVYRGGFYSSILENFPLDFKSDQVKDASNSYIPLERGQLWEQNLSGCVVYYPHEPLRTVLIPQAAPNVASSLLIAEFFTQEMYSGQEFP